MKHFLIICMICFATLYAHTQNIGIGTTTPQSTLDVKGNQRLGGATNFITYDSASGKYTWTNSHLWVPSAQYLVKHSASSEGLYYNNSQLEYRYQDGTPRFYTNWNTGDGYFYGNLGVGVNPPVHKLHVGNGLVRMEGPANPGGVALSMGGYGDFQIDAPGLQGGRFTVDHEGNVGIGILAPNARLDVRRGTAAGGTAHFWGTQYVSHFSFGVNEDTYIRAGKNNGNVILNDVPGGKVGIGTPTPGFLLSFPNAVGDKISLWGSSGAHYGFGIQGSLLQVHTDGAGSDIAFGYGSSSLFTERFRFKGTGAIVVNGAEGQNGQLMRSNGSGQPATWSNPLNDLYNNMTEYVQSGTLTLGPLSTGTNIPGMSGIQLVLTTPSKVILDATAHIRSNGCFGCGGSTTSFVAQIYLTSGGPVYGASSQGNIGVDETKTFATGMKIVSLNPGTYTVNGVCTNNNISGPTITISFARLNVFVIEQ